MREVTAAGQLSGHPHVVPVYDAGVLADNRPYMVLELCPGGSLGDRLHRQGALPAKEARDIGVGLADAVAAAHAAGVLHRDIKPGNIMVNRYGGVALTDFGLAAMPRPGRELSVTREALTPAYAPPEAFRMADPSPAGDVYSLAATVYALLCGRPPHYPRGRHPAQPRRTDRAPHLAVRRPPRTAARLQLGAPIRPRGRPRPPPVRRGRVP